MAVQRQCCSRTCVSCVSCVSCAFGESGLLPPCQLSTVRRISPSTTSTTTTVPIAVVKTKVHRRPTQQLSISHYCCTSARTGLISLFSFRSRLLSQSLLLAYGIAPLPPSLPYSPALPLITPRPSGHTYMTVHTYPSSHITAAGYAHISNPSGPVRPYQLGQSFFFFPWLFYILHLPIQHTRATDFNTGSGSDRCCLLVVGGPTTDGFS
jgi:hypothetical protein